jgi:hypothetical protein
MPVAGFSVRVGPVAVIRRPRSADMSTAIGAVYSTSTTPRAK